MSTRLLPSLSQLLRDFDLEPDALAGVAYSCGPGSFTSLRTGLTIAKTMSMAIGCPLIAVPTLLARLENIPPGDESTRWALSDARRQEAYAARYRWNGSAWWSEVPATTLSLGQLAAWQREESSKPTTRIVAEASLKLNVEVLPAASANMVARLAVGAIYSELPQDWEAQLGCGVARVDPWRVEPVYGRPPDAKLPGGIIPKI